MKKAQTESSVRALRIVAPCGEYRKRVCGSKLDIGIEKLVPRQPLLAQLGQERIGIDSTDTDSNTKSNGNTNGKTDSNTNDSTDTDAKSNGNTNGCSDSHTNADCFNEQ